MNNFAKAVAITELIVLLLWIRFCGLAACTVHLMRNFPAAMDRVGQPQSV